MAVREEKRRGERRWVIDIVYRNPDGSPARFRKDADVQTRQAARAEEHRRLAVLALTGSPAGSLPEAPARAASSEAPRVEPKPLDPVVPTNAAPLFRDVAKEYLESYATTNLKPSTRLGYTRRLQYLVGEIGNLPITEVAAKSREIDVKLVERGVKASTRAGYQIVLRSVVGRFAVERGYLSSPTFPKLPRQGKKIHTALAPEEVDRLLAAASRPEHRRAFLLAAYAGLRAGEIRALRWRDVDLKDQTLTVRMSRCRGILSTPKSGNERLIPLPEILVGELSLTPKDKREPNALVATTRYGKPWGEYGLRQVFERTCERAGLSGWRFHDLRHYFVTSLFRAGAPAPAVQALAGHADLATTQRYAHTTRADLQAAMKRLTATAVATAWQQTVDQPDAAE